MALYAITNGNTSTQLDLNQYQNWLALGTITDQVLNLIYNGASSLATLTQNGAGDCLTIVGVTAGHYSIKDTSSGKWQVGSGGMTITGGGLTVSAGGVTSTTGNHEVVTGNIYVDAGHLVVGGNSGFGDSIALLFGFVTTGINQYGITVQANPDHTATSLAVGIDSIIITQSAAFTIANAYTIHARDPQVNNTAITNSYGLYVDSMVSGVTNYAVYTNTGLNNLGDQLTVRSGPIIGNMSTDTFSNAVTITVDRTKGNMHFVAATSNTASTFTPSAAGTAGQEMTILITADGTGGNVITFASTFKPNGTLTTTANKGHTIKWISDGSHWWETSRVLAL